MIVGWESFREGMADMYRGTHFVQSRDEVYPFFSLYCLLHDCMDVCWGGDSGRRN